MLQLSFKVFKIKAGNYDIVKKIKVSQIKEKLELK